MYIRVFSFKLMHMGGGIYRAMYFRFIGAGRTFHSKYGEGELQIHHFKRCEVENDVIVVKDLQRYQMYVPVGDSTFIFDKEKIYDLREVSGAGKEDISGTINLSHHVVPVEYTDDEFIQHQKKMKKFKSVDAPELRKYIKEADIKEREEIDRRLGRLN